MRPSLRIILTAGAALVAVALATNIAAQNARPDALRLHQQRAEGTRRGVRLTTPVQPLPRGQASTRGHTRSGALFLLFDYDLTRGILLDLNGPDDASDLGNREFLEGDVWLSNAFGDRFRLIGEVVVTEDFLEADRADTGTDILQTIDLVLFGEGQLRAGGFWNVRDGGRGDPLLPVLGTTGTKFLRRYHNGQLRFIARSDEDEELFLLEK